jgi:nicotinate-nucleotide adenylyltransferase
MLVEALAKHKKLVPCDLEMERKTPSWTIDTVNLFHKKFPKYHFYFISGSEGFLNIPLWKNYKTLLKLIPFIVLLRSEEHLKKIKALAKREGVGVCENFNKEDYHSSKIYIYRYKSDKLDISSTLIRNNSRNKKSIKGLVTGEVEQIMKELNLYEN